VVTDRRILDDQIQTTIKQFMQVGATVGHAEHSGRPAQVHRGGKKIIISHGAEVPVHPRRDRDRGGKTFRHHHRRGPLQPGRQDLGGDERGEDSEADPEDT
jgi:type I restriction enzyme R subunit